MQTREKLITSGTIFGASLLGYGLERLFHIENFGHSYELIQQSTFYAAIASGVITGAIGIKAGLETLLDRVNTYDPQ